MTDPAERSDTQPSAVEGGDWPPVSFAQNDHILVWWLPEYDDALKDLVDTWQWDWKRHVLPTLQDIIPRNVLEAWRRSDPLCKQYSWYNILSNFAVARAKQYRITAREAQAKTCPGCSKQFR